MRQAFLTRSAGAAPKSITIEQSWLHKGRIVLKFAGIDSISDAEVLRGAEVVIPAAERLTLDPDAAYISDLEGCRLFDVSQPGQPVIGTVLDVIQQEETADLLVVSGDEGVEHLIPFARAYLVRIDIPSKRVEMNLPAGLLEINRPLSDEEKRANDDGAAEKSV